MSTPGVASGDESESTGIDPTTPLLGNRTAPSLGGATRFLRRASSQHMLREPSIRVREAAVEHIEERQFDFASSKPMVAFALIHNMANVVASVSVLMLSLEEKAPARLRWWVVVFAIQTLLEMACISVEYRRRRRQPYRGAAADETSVFEKLRYWNSNAIFIWCFFGLYWVSAISPDDAPQLYWLIIILTGSGFIILAVILAMAFVIGIGICCCLPCIIAILYAMAPKQGAKTEDIERLPRFKFQKQNAENIDQESFAGGKVRECDTDSPMEYLIPLEDAECSICLNSYEDGTELRELPCRHHFHSGCVDKWLHINATCPLCKLNIDNQNGSEQV